MTADSGLSQIAGRRLIEARELRGMTQEVAAEHLGLSRPTLIAIEKGERAARPAEIVKLAALYGRPVHWFARTSEPVPDFQPHFRVAVDRAKPVDAEQSRRAIDEFKQFVENYLDLERRMKAPLKLNYPPTLDLNPRVNVTELTEDVAARERQRLGLGDQPIPNIRDILESEVGVRIFLNRLPGTLAGMYLFVDGLGGCLLINSVHPVAKQRASIAHEYAHLIVDRHSPGIDYLTVAGRKPANERFAEAFAMSFLMPAASVRFRFNEVVNATGNFQVADLVRTKHFFHVSLEAMSHRLEGLGLLRAGTWDLLKEQGLPIRQAEEKLGLPTEDRVEPAFPERYRFLAVQAYERGELTEKELANYLRCDVWEARQTVKEFLQSVEVDLDGQSQSLSIDLNFPLLADPA